MRWICILAPALAACGTRLIDPCDGQAGTCLAIQVESSSVDRIDGLAIALDGTGFSANRDLTNIGSQRLPIAVAVLFDSLPQSSLQLSIVVTGKFGNVVVGMGAADATVTTTRHATVHVQLAASSGGGDLEALGDLTGVTDQAVSADLSIPDDFAGADLAFVPDLIPPPIIITPAGAQVGTGQRRTFRASVPVTWSVMEAAAGVMDSSTGAFTGGATPGVYHVVATRVAAPNDSAFLSFEVIARTLALVAGSTFGTMDGAGASAQFKYVVGIDRDAAGDLYVADFSAHTIRHIFRASQLVERAAGQPGVSGAVDGDALNMATLAGPTGVAIDRVGKVLYTIENTSGKLRVLDITAKQVSTPTLGDTLNMPGGLCYDGQGHLYVAEAGANRIRRINISDFSIAALPGAAGGATFNTVKGVACDTAHGYLYTADWGNAVNRLDLATGDVLLIAGGTMGSGNDLGASASFYHPEGITLDDSGFLYVADTFNFLVRKINLSNSSVTTLAGNGTSATVFGALPGGLNLVGGIAWMPSGELIVADNSYVAAIEGP